MSWDEIVSALSMLWARQKPELLQLLQPGLNKALRLALVGTALMAVLLAALLAVRLVKKQKKGLVALGICLGLCVGVASAAPYSVCRGRRHRYICLGAQRAGRFYLCALHPGTGER